MTPAIQAMIDVGVPVLEAIRCTGNLASGGPVKRDVKEAWGIVPFVGSGKHPAHFWIRKPRGFNDHPAILNRVVSACNLTRSETKAAPLLGAGQHGPLRQVCGITTAAGQGMNSDGFILLAAVVVVALSYVIVNALHKRWAIRSALREVHARRLYAGHIPPGPLPARATQRVTLVTCTEAEIVAAFTEWDRRYRANPVAFVSEVPYGEACAAYFISLLREQP